MHSWEETATVVSSLVSKPWLTCRSLSLWFYIFLSRLRFRNSSNTSITSFSSSGLMFHGQRVLKHTLTEEGLEAQLHADMASSSIVNRGFSSVIFYFNKCFILLLCRLHLHALSAHYFGWLLCYSLATLLCSLTKAWFHCDLGHIDKSQWRKFDSRIFGISRSIIPQASWVLLKILRSEGKFCFMLVLFSVTIPFTIFLFHIYFLYTLVFFFFTC